jgi:hypothetical protein
MGRPFTVCFFHLPVMFFRDLAIWQLPHRFQNGLQLGIASRSGFGVHLADSRERHRASFSSRRPKCGVAIRHHDQPTY